MAETAGIYATESLYLDRFVQIGMAGDRVISLSFPRDQPADAAGSHPLINRIERYLDGTRESFEDVKLAMTVQTDHRHVLSTVRTIPYATQRDVESVARMTPTLSADEPADIDTVRNALDANPVPLIIPDHRVRDGGSGAPADVEQRLRALEGL